MKLQRLYSYVRQALDDYHMIEAGDRIAIGISGGKDSLTLLYAMAGLRRFYPVPFEICAVTVDLGFREFDLSEIKKLCEHLQVEYHVVQTQISQIVFDERKEKSPCSLCAKMRKGALNDYLKTIGYNKAAYAHHMDDMIETMIMSLIYEGRFYSFPPVTNLTRSEITVIRPLMYVPEADVIGFQNKYELPVVKNPCPADSITHREYVKQIVKQLNHENPGVKKRLFHAIVNGNIEGWNNYGEIKSIL